MRDPRKTLLDWWQWVNPGGHLILIVPDEDLCEQGVFPSQFNPAHTCAFTMGKARSWSPVSLNVRDLARDLPNAEIIQLTLREHGSDRRRQSHSGIRVPPSLAYFVRRLRPSLGKRGWQANPYLDRALARLVPIDQTTRPDVLAQIQGVLRKPGERPAVFLAHGGRLILGGPCFGLPAHQPAGSFTSPASRHQPTPDER